MWPFPQERLDLRNHHGEEGFFDRRNVQVSKRRQVDFRGSGSESCIVHGEQDEIDVTERGASEYLWGSAPSRLRVCQGPNGDAGVSGEIRGWSDRTFATLSILLQVKTNSSKP